jgi:glucose-1-phosphate adenylyltransferase
MMARTLAAILAGGKGSRLRSYARNLAKPSVMFGGAHRGRRARVHRAIIDKEVSVPDGVEIGCDSSLDRSRGFVITDNGVTEVASNYDVQRFAAEEATA